MACPMVVVVVSLISLVTGSPSVLSGPGLQPHSSVLPCRYFFVNTSAINTEGLKVSISGGDEAGRICRPHTEILPVSSELVVVRYKLYYSCHDLQISVQTPDLLHVPGSPVRVPGVSHSDSCHCPVARLDQWRTDNSCPASSPQMRRDLDRFSSGVDMREAVLEARKLLSHGGSQCWCHYVVKVGKVYRRCYGQHTGFRMFWDSLLSWLTRRAVIPDTEILVNLGDWPLIKTSDKPIPMISWCGSSDTSDMVLPTYELTESSVECMGRQSLDVLASLAKNNVPWQDKTEKIFWRGRDSNKERLKLVKMSKENPEFINASLTAFFFFREEEAKLGRAPHVPFFDFFDYKYQLCVDGTVAAYRLPYLLAGGSVVFKTQSKYFEHFYPDLTPWTHFIPVKEDLSDLLEMVKWARDNDDKCLEISRNAREFVIKNLLPDKVFCYYATFISHWTDLLTSEVEVGEGMEELDTDLTTDKRFGSCQCHNKNTHSQSPGHQHSKDEL